MTKTNPSSGIASIFVGPAIIIFEGKSVYSILSIKIIPPRFEEISKVKVAYSQLPSLMVASSL